jgi:hypothetical protein
MLQVCLTRVDLAATGTGAPKLGAKGENRGIMRPVREPEEPRSNYLLEGVLLAALILGPGIAVAVAMDSRHGSVADWVSALATVAAFIAAVAAGQTAARLWRIESKRDDERRSRDKQEQALLIAAWYGSKTWRPASVLASGNRMPGPRGEFGVWVRNASQVPVTGVVVRVIGQDGSALYAQGMGTVPPAADPVFVPAPRDVHGLLRVQHWECSAEIMFIDAGDQPWTRERSGRLRDGLHGARPSRPEDAAP